jgi:hypothetical protein
MPRGEHTIKIYHWLAKKSYLGGKHVYEYERVYVPIPSRLHDKIKPFLDQHLKIEITNQNGTLVITMHPVKSLSHAEKPPVKLAPKHDRQASF